VKPRYFTKKRSQGHKPGEMNSTETAYRDLLMGRVAAATIHRFLFEAITFKLADDVRYTPDFAVWMPDGTLEFHEVKASSGDGETLIDPNGRTKIKVAARMLPEFRFVMCVRATKKNGWGWKYEEVGI